MKEFITITTIPVLTVKNDNLLQQNSENIELLKKSYKRRLCSYTHNKLCDKWNYVCLSLVREGNEMKQESKSQINWISVMLKDYKKLLEKTGASFVECYEKKKKRSSKISGFFT